MKIINFVLGLGTAIIVSSLIVLGISAFYPEPVAPVYPTSPVPASQPCSPSSNVNCPTQAQEDSQAQYQAAQNQYDQQEQAYEAATKVYDRNLFIVANIIGIIIFALAFWLLFATSIVVQSVPVGIMVAGIWSIMYGYMRGWGSVDDKLKFFVGLVIALLVIGGSMWLIERYAKKRNASQ